MIDTTGIHGYVDIGAKDKNWYQECQAVFETLYGKERLQLVCRLFAATSINTSLKSNITLFRRALHEIDNNLPISNYLPNIQIQLERIRQGLPLSGRKINAFASAMSGDPNAVVVDIWLMRAFGLESKRMVRKKGSEEKVQKNGSPSTKQYDAVENWVREEAARMGVEPRQLSAMIWAGVRITQSGDKETHYKTLLWQAEVNLFNAEKFLK